MFSFLSKVGGALKTGAQDVGNFASSAGQNMLGIKRKRQPFDEQPEMPEGGAMSEQGKAPMSPTTPNLSERLSTLTTPRDEGQPSAPNENHFDLDPGNRDTYTDTRADMGNMAPHRYSGKERLMEALKNAGAGALAGMAQGGLGGAVGGAVGAGVAGAVKPQAGPGYRYNTLERPRIDAENARQAQIQAGQDASELRRAQIEHTRAQTGAIHVPTAEESALELEKKRGEVAQQGAVKSHTEAQTKEILAKLERGELKPHTITGPDGKPHIIFYDPNHPEHTVDPGMVDASVMQRMNDAAQRASEAEKNRANSRSIAGMHEAGANARTDKTIKATGERQDKTIAAKPQANAGGNVKSQVYLKQHAHDFFHDDVKAAEADLKRQGITIK